MSPNLAPDLPAVGAGGAGISQVRGWPRLFPGPAVAGTPWLCGEIRATGDVLRDQLVLHDSQRFRRV
jgi:hypothetical protein